MVDSVVTTRDREGEGEGDGGKVIPLAYWRSRSAVGSRAGSRAPSQLREWKGQEAEGGNVEGEKEEEVGDKDVS